MKIKFIIEPANGSFFMSFGRGHISEGHPSKRFIVVFQKNNNTNQLWLSELCSRRRFEKFSDLPIVVYNLLPRK